MAVEPSTDSEVCAGPWGWGVSGGVAATVCELGICWVAVAETTDSEVRAGAWGRVISGEVAASVLVDDVDKAGTSCMSSLIVERWWASTLWTFIDLYVSEAQSIAYLFTLLLVKDWGFAA